MSQTSATGFGSSVLTFNRPCFTGFLTLRNHSMNEQVVVEQVEDEVRELSLEEQQEVVGATFSESMAR